jgi:hypothetical protein
MSDFTVRSDSVNVEQIMEQIRARIREKRGVDYTEQQIRELATVKLEKFLDPRAVRSDLLQQFQKMQAEHTAATPSVTFGPNAIFEAQRPIVAKIRRLLHPVLRLFFNPDPISQALVRLNDIDPRADMYYELFHNLVIELTRTSIEVKNLKMRVESLTGRLEFNERRARALESVVVYKPSNDEQPSEASSSRLQSGEPSRGSRGSQGLHSPQIPSMPSPSPSKAEAQPLVTSPSPGAALPSEGPGQRSRRRRRRRGRRGGGSATALLGGGSGPLDPASGRSATDSAADAATSTDRAAELESAPDRPGARSDSGPDAAREHNQSTDSDPNEP